MKAQVKAINMSASKGSYNGISITLQPEGGKPAKEHFIFGNNPMVKDIKSLDVGDWVDAGMTKNGQFWNLSSLTKAASAGTDTPAGKPGATAPAKSSYGSRFADSEEYVTKRDVSISRMSAAKSSIDLVSTMLEQGLYKKSVTPEFIWQEVQRYAKSIETYVSGKDIADMYESSTADLGSSSSGDDDPFPG